MSLVGLRTLLDYAEQGGFAIGAFNTMDHAFAEGIMQAAEATMTPVILAGGDFPGPDYNNFLPYLLDRIARSPIPVCFHFDHGSSFEACARAIRAGYSSVMIDGSALPYEENVCLTKRVVDMAHACGVDVEGEIGHTGSNEASMESALAEGFHTEPDVARQFVQDTGVDALAVAFGTAHGVYKKEPKLDFQRLSAINDAVDIPLVMHGSSGIKESDFKQAIRNGIQKINAFTNLTLKVTRELDAAMRDMAIQSTMSHMISLRMTELAKDEVIRHILMFETKPMVWKS